MMMKRHENPDRQCENRDERGTKMKQEDMMQIRATTTAISSMSLVFQGANGADG